VNGFIDFGKQNAERLSAENLNTQKYWNAVKEHRDAELEIRQHPPGENYKRDLIYTGTNDFEAAEAALNDQIVYASKLGMRDRVLEIYAQKEEFYRKYWYLSRFQDSNEVAAERQKTLDNAGAMPVGSEKYRKLLLMYTPAELIVETQKQAEQYAAAGTRDTTTAARGTRQSVANYAGQARNLIEQIDKSAAENRLADIRTFVNSALTGESRSVVVDVDEKALSEGRSAVTNVYFDFGAGKRVKVLEQYNTGVRQDRTVKADDDLIKILTEAFSPQKPNR
jgi:hypothetical protein